VSLSTDQSLDVAGAKARPRPKKAKHRSAIANASKMLAGLDGRSALARRYRDLLGDARQHLGSLTQW
jgi:hypothetical protein